MQLLRQLLTKSYVHQRMFLLGNRTAIRPSSSDSAATGANIHAVDEPAQPSDEPIDISNPFEREKQKCILCQMNVQPNYKNVRLLSQFQSPYTGRIYGRHITGLCKAQQQRVEQEITRAQRAGFMGSYNKSVEFLQDPKLFDPERPIRPHHF